MFTSYVALRHRDAYPRIAELLPFLEGVCQKIAFPHFGKMEMVEEHCKLLTSDDNLKDHVLHLHYQMLHVFLVWILFPRVP